jgi:YjbE family integral membrane protein
VELLLEEFTHPAYWFAALQIIWINILLSGDNAVVIALACRSLAPRQRLWGMILGAGAAVLLRIIFTAVVAQIMAFPYLKLIGGVLLLWIAIKLLVPEEDHGEGKVKAADSLWPAVRIIVIADLVMSLDNVIAIAGAADSAAVKMAVGFGAQQALDLAYYVKFSLIAFGLTTSVPLIIAGSALLMAMLDRFPILVWAGAGLLGWVAGEIIIKDAAVAGYLGEAFVHRWELWAATAGVLAVLGVGWMIRRSKHKSMLEQPLITDPPGPEEFPHGTAVQKHAAVGTRPSRATAALAESSHLQEHARRR